MAEAGDDIRISNAERDEAVSTLGQHLSTDRLELDEYEERCGRAAVARTRGELLTLFTDLPAPHPDLSSAMPPATTGGGNEVVKVDTGASKALEAVAAVGFLIGIPAAILLTIFAGAWWLFIPVGIVVIVAGSAADEAKKRKH